MARGFVSLLQVSGEPVHDAPVHVADVRALADAVAFTPVDGHLDRRATVLEAAEELVALA